MAPRSMIWRYFTKLSKELAKCNICSKNLKTSGTTSNLSNHLKQKHHHIYNEFQHEGEREKKISEDLVAEASGKRLHLQNKENSEKPQIQISENQDKSKQPEKSCLSMTSAPVSTSIEVEIEQTTPSTSGKWPISYTGTAPKHSIEKKQRSIIDAVKDVSSYSDGGSKHVKITEAVVNFIVQDNLPFSAVEGKGFVGLMKTIAPLYKVPTRNTIKERIDKKYEVISNSFKMILRSAKNVSVTTDIWTADMQTKSFIGLTVHFIKNNEFLSATLGITELSESHTADYISTSLSNILKEWDIELNDVTAVVTDNAANMVRAIQDTFGRNKHVPCFAHTINLIAENALKNSDEAMALIEKIRAIVVWFKRSVNISDQLRAAQKNEGLPEGKILKLILDVKTRWNSTYYMLERYLKLAPLVGTILLSNLTAPCTPPNALDLQNLKNICLLLQPLEGATREISGQEYITLSKVIPMIGCLISQYEAIKDFDDINLGKQLKKNILNEFQKRCGTVERCFLLAASTILDPRFKNIHFRDPLGASSVIRHLKNEMETNLREQTASSSSDRSVSPESNEFDLWAHHKQMAHSKKSKKNDSGQFDELSQYLSVPVRNLKENPLVVWDEMKSIYPNLFSLAQNYLSVPATSVPSERLFSKAGATLTKNRSRLTGEHASKIIFLSSLSEKILQL